MYVLLFFLLTWLAVIDPLITQGAALALAGALAVPIAQAIKKATSLSGGAALIVAGVISVVLAVVAVFVTGQPHGVKDFVASAAVVFAISQAVFKLILADPPKG